VSSQGDFASMMASLHFARARGNTARFSPPCRRSHVSACAPPMC